MYDTGEYAKALDKVLEAGGYAELRAEQAARRERGDAVQLGIGRPVLRGDHRRRRVRRGRLGRGARGRHRHRAHRHLAARPGARHRVGHAGQRAARHPDREDHRQPRRHRPDPARRRDHGLAQPAAPAGSRCTRRPGELVELAKQRAADLLEANVDDLALDLAPRRSRCAGDPARGVTLAELAEREQLKVDTRTSTAAAPTFPFGAHVAVVEVDIETGKAVVQRIVTVDDAGHGAEPAARRGPAARRDRPGHRPGAAGGGRLRRRRQPADRHASPTTRSRRPPSCPASSWSTWRRRPT